MFRKLKDPASALSHLLGALLSVAGLVYLLCRAVTQATVWHTVSFAIYGGSLILLYTASTVYHAVRASEHWTRILRKLDHSMIFVLIAGTYTPICLVVLEGAWRWSLLSGVWAIAVAGIVLKLLWLEAPRWLSTVIYVVMGWLVVVASAPLTRSMVPAGLWWLLAGGILYSVGAAIYGTKWPRITIPGFGFHEIFHLFVLGGSLAHFWVMVRFVLAIPQ
ncbi:MAG: hemolysin III family protein [Bacillota bacterium]